MKGFILSSWFLYVFSFFIAVCIGNMGHVAFLYLAFGIGVLEIIFCNIKKNFCFSLFLIPNIRILDDIGINFAINILMVLPIVKYILVKRKLYPQILVCALLFFLIEISHDVAYDMWKSFFPMLCWLFAFVYSMSVLFNNSVRVSMFDIYRSLGCGITVTSVTYLIANKEYAMSLLAKTMSGYRFEAYANDPNYFSMYICITLAMLFALPSKNLFHQFVFLGLCFIGLLTGSKMCLLLISFILLYVFCSQGLRCNKDGKFVRISAFLLVAITVAMSSQLMVFVNNFAKRAGLNNISLELNVLTTGRTTLMYEYIKFFFSHADTFLLGHGMEYTSVINILFHGAHNTYLDIALSWGMVGIIIFAVALFNLFSHARLNLKKPLLYYLPLICVLLNFMDLSCFNATMFWFIVVAVLFPFRRQIVRLGLEHEAIN